MFSRTKLLRRRVWRLAIGVLAAFVAAPAHAADDAPVDVLQLSSANIEESTATGNELAGLAALADGDPSTVATASASESAPLAIVWGFGGEDVAIEELQITLPAAAGDAPPPAQLDLLVSTSSPHAGFRSVRTDPLAAVAEPQKFALLPTGAKWVMLRFTPQQGASQLSVAEVALVGRAGPPATHYQFKEAPAKAFDVLRRLEKTSAVHIELTDEERSLFADARDGTLNDWTFDEAALFASGVLDESRRKEYLAKLEKIEADARDATQDFSQPFDRGRALLEFLHKGPMAGGYESEQTDVSAILDAGKFNCVSSATLFNILGRRLGLDCRGVEVPQHAFSIVYDGVARADVETTTSGGFNPVRDEAAQEEFTRLTGFAYIPDSNRDQRREVDELGLVAVIYYNHGVTLGDEKHFHDALVAYFRAMSLDPENDSAVKNALAVLANWGVELADEAKFEDALNVVGTGIDLAPEDATLVNNRRAVWSEWVESLAEGGKSDEAVELLRRAAAEVPDGDFLRQQAWVFIREGEESIEQGDWEAALACVEPALEKVDAAAQEELRNWGDNLYLRWAQSEQEQGRFEPALAVVERALAAKPDDDRLINQLAYLVQERAGEAANVDVDEATKLMAEMLTKYGSYEDVREVAESFAHRTVNKLVGDEKFDDALATAKQIAQTLNNSELALELAQSIYGQRVSARIEVKDWAGALGALAEQRERFPDDDDPEVNIRYCIQEWAKFAYDQEGTAAGEQVIDEQMERFKAVDDLDRIALGYFQRVVQDLAAKAKYDEALAAAGRSAKWIADENRVAEMQTLVYDAQAAAPLADKKWQAAIDVYSAGIQAHPNNEPLKREAIRIWNEWANVHMDAGEWDAAIGVYERALQQFPEDGLLENNLAYCRQEAARAK